MGSGIFPTTRITSSALVLTDGGNLPLRLLEARLFHRAARYHFRARRLLRRSRRSFIFSFTSLRCLISAESRTRPFPTQAIPVVLLPLSIPHVMGWTCPSHCQVS